MDGLRASRGLRWRMLGGSVLLVVALADRSALLGLIALALLIPAAVTAFSAARATRTAEPWPWPTDFRALAEGMARAVDPTPKRLLPPDERAAGIAQVATTKEALSRLIADKPPAWPWAVLASVLVQRRNAVQERLRRCASGYQPRAGVSSLSGAGYTHVARGAIDTIADLIGQTEQFMRSPAFTGMIGDATRESSADPEAIVAAANRLMDYHEAFLAQAETCLQTPVEPAARVFVADMGAFALCPLLGFEQFIPTMCTRVAEAQELLPYTKADQVIALDDANLVVELPEGLSDRVLAHFEEFSRAP